MVVNRHRASSMAFPGKVNEDEIEKSMKTLSDLREIYKDIRYDWPQLVSGEVSPIELAISFLDDTSVGLAHRKKEFDDLCEATGNYIRAAMMENHETFTNSIGMYHSLISQAQQTQQDSKDIKELIEYSTKDMRDRSTSLKDLDVSSTKYAEMIDILDAMEYLRDIPGQIEQLISEKKIHEVYDVIAAGYKTASQYNLWSLSSMNATQNYLEMQSNNLYDLIVDEIQNEIYLKSMSSTKESWSQIINSNSPQITSFMTLINNSTTLESFIYNSANLDINEISASLTEITNRFLDVQLPMLHEHYSKTHEPKTNYSLLLEANSNPSTSSYFYIYMLLFTASKLNKLYSVTEILLHSLQSELQEMITQITHDCKQSNQHKLARLEKSRALENNKPQDIISGHGLYDSSVNILQDYFGLFFYKCLNVLSRHKVTCEVVRKIQSNDEILTSTKRSQPTEGSRPKYNFNTVWSIMSREISSLISSYIQEDIKHNIAARSDIGPSQIHQVLKERQLFKLENAAGSNSLNVSEELKSVLDEMFPGFSIGSHNQYQNQNQNKQKNNQHNKQQNQNQNQNPSQMETNSPFITTERLCTSIDVLVPENIFNMRVILEFLLIFVAGSNTLFTDSMSADSNTTPISFLRDIMQNSFLVRLREQLNHAFDTCMTSDVGVDLRIGKNKTVYRFSQTTTQLASENPAIERSYLQRMPKTSHVYANAVQFEALLVNACFTLNTSFDYRKDFCNLVLNMLTDFASLYETYFKELLATGGTLDITEMNLGIPGERIQKVSKLNKWLNAYVLTDISETLFDAQNNVSECDLIISKECDVMFHETDQDTRVSEVCKDDMMDDESFHHMCVLLTSVSWILTWLPSMRKLSNHGEDHGVQIDLNQLRHDYTVLDNGRAPLFKTENSHHVYLTLNPAAISLFDNVVNTFKNLRSKALLALRYDLRLKISHHIKQSFSDNLLLTTEPADSDPFISMLNREVFFIGTKADEFLSANEKHFIFMGLPAYLNRAFVRSSKLISIINRNGIKRIILNIFTSQQMLRSVMRKEDKIDLSRSSRYFEMFTLNEINLLQIISTDTYSYTKKEVLNLLRLIYSEKLKVSSASSFNKSRYNELVNKVNELF